MSYIDQITVGSTTYDIQDSNAQRKTISGSGAPTSSTAAEVGTYYINTSATTFPYLYICLDDTGGTYTWKDVSSSLTILSYGSSTWNDFITAYNNNAIVYCRASSNSNPASGSQGRMAFMAFINFSGSTPTSVEFQYYRSVSSHSASQQGDQVFIYKLTNANAWSVTTREASSKIAAGARMSSSYSSGTITLNGDSPIHVGDSEPTDSNVNIWYDTDEPSPFMDYGSNANGQYLKFPNGVLICWKSCSFSSLTTTSWGGMYETTSKVDFGNWAYAFTSVPQVSLLPTGSGWAFMPEILSDKSTTKVGKSYLCRGSAASNASVSYDVIGIGRWK